MHQGKFPYQELSDLGYNITIFGQKTYNGVAILSKYPPEDIIAKLEHYSKYVDEQQSELAYIEDEKEKLEQTFFTSAKV